MSRPRFQKGIGEHEPKHKVTIIASLVVIASLVENGRISTKCIQSPKKTRAQLFKAPLAK